MDMMVLSMYLASFTLRVLIMLKGHFLCQAPDGTEECAYFTQTGERKRLYSTRDMDLGHYHGVRFEVDVLPGW